MDPLIRSSVELYGVSTALTNKAIDGLSAEELHKKAGPDTNPAIPIFTHLAHSRCSLLRLLGSDCDLPWDGRFGRGGAMDDPSKYPELNDVRAVWKDVGERLHQRFEELTDEELSAGTPRRFLVPDPTIRGAINFLAYHEAYHVGQLAYLYKWLGQGALVD